MNDINCPYCDAEQEINHDDGRGYEENETHQQQCSECNKYFVFTTSISFFYDAEKADCLNDGEHNFEPTQTFPKEYSKMRCSDCGEIRECKKEEMNRILKNDKQLN